MDIFSTVCHRVFGWFLVIFLSGIFCRTQRHLLKKTLNKHLYYGTSNCTTPHVQSHWRMIIDYLITRAILSHYLTRLAFIVAYTRKIYRRIEYVSIAQRSVLVVWILFKILLATILAIVSGPNSNFSVARNFVVSIRSPIVKGP